MIRFIKNFLLILHLRLPMTMYGRQFTHHLTRRQKSDKQLVLRNNPLSGRKWSTIKAYQKNMKIHENAHTPYMQRHLLLDQQPALPHDAWRPASSPLPTSGSFIALLTLQNAAVKKTASPAASLNFTNFMGHEGCKLPPNGFKVHDMGFPTTTQSRLRAYS
jgi:hypothetical protein